MIWLRYLFFSVISLLIHSLAFSSEGVPTLSYSVTKSQERALSIQLMTLAKPKTSTKTASIEQTKRVEKNNKMKKKSPPKEVATVKKSPPKIVKKVSKAAPKKVAMVTKKVAPTPNVEKPKVKKAPEQLKTVEPEPQKILPEIDELHKKLTEPQEAIAEAAVEEQEEAETEVAVAVKPTLPKMVEKVTFSARPSPIKYPHSAKRRNLEGVVLVEVWIDALGQQTKQLIVNSSGHEVLDNAAIKAITEWQFSRHQAGGLAIAHRVQVPINFELN